MDSLHIPDGRQCADSDEPAAAMAVEPRNKPFIRHGTEGPQRVRLSPVIEKIFGADNEINKLLGEKPAPRDE
jgi:hypothetical protein